MFPRYDMNAGESRVTGIIASDPNAPADQRPNLEPGCA